MSNTRYVVKKFEYEMILQHAVHRLGPQKQLFGKLSINRAEQRDIFFPSVVHASFTHTNHYQCYCIPKILTHITYTVIIELNTPPVPVVELQKY